MSQNPRIFDKVQRQKLVICMFSGLLLGVCLLQTGCSTPEYQTIQGQTMGTYYAVSVAQDDTCLIQPQMIESSLQAVNDTMSTYQADSELTRINHSSAQQKHTLSPDLAQVIDVALQIWRQSQGAFDVTVGPLVNLWGFGPEVEAPAPTLAAQQAAAASVGMDKLDVDGVHLSKKLDAVYIDLSALAKGFGVDQLASLLEAQGCANYMVDIGGEIRVAGKNPRGQNWRIGIEVPDPGQIGVLQTVLSLSDLSVATSGDYRNYRVIDGVRVDHVIDPRTGKPADNRVVSATVLHPSAMWADAYATTLMALDLEEGVRFAEKEGIAAYIMARMSPASPGMNAEDQLEFRYTAAMRAYLPPDLDSNGS